MEIPTPIASAREDVVADRRPFEQPHYQQKREESEEHACAVGPYDAPVGDPSGSTAHNPAPASPTAVEKQRRPERNTSGIAATAKAIDHNLPIR